MLTVFTILLAATAPAPKQNPDAAVFEALNSGTVGSCVMFDSGCICSDNQVYVRDVRCSETQIANERICSYNLAMWDASGIDSSYAYQRMDLMLLSDDGKWSFVREYTPPVEIPYFRR
jgi:hypothetical protein